MLDIQFIRDNREVVEKAAQDKGAKVSIEELLKLDDQRRGLIQQIDEARAKRNELSNEMKGGKPSPESIAQVKEIKDQLTQLEDELEQIENDYKPLLDAVPNIPSEDTPVGDSEDQNEVLRTVGEKPDFGFEPKPHWEMERFIQEERAARISGARFSFIQNGVAQLQMALMLWGMNELTNPDVIKKIIADNNLEVADHPFMPVLPPVMMRTDPYAATTRLKPDDVTFKLANDDLWLIGSSEHSLCAYYMGETIEEEMPIRMVGYSPAFRREVGSAGKDTRGILRVHQFNKLEMESFTKPEDSRSEHEFLIAIQEYLTQKLGLPYQVVLKCTFDMGGPNARGVDIETWMPGQQLYRETHSADLLTDYQARGLNTKYVNEDGKKALVHTNDATAIADRTLIAIMENYQNEDGTIRVPEVLQPFMGGREVI